MSERQLTPVFDGAKDLPVRKGWYAIKSKYSEFDPDETLRSYWNGFHFSRFVAVGDDDDEEADRCEQMPSSFENHELYWCGLTAPYES